MSLRFSLLGLIGLVTLASLGCAALVQPGPRWLGVLVTLTACGIVWQLLRALLRDGVVRASACGWLVFTVAYLAIALGPWLGREVGPQLLSTKSLVYAQVNWRKEDPGSYMQLQQHGMWSDDWMRIVDGTSSTILTNSGTAFVPVQLGTQAVSVNFFQQSGQWLFAWLAGWIGSVVAVHCWRQREVSQ